MPISLQWHNDARDIIYLCYEEFTTPEHYQAVEDARAMMDTVPHNRVDLIIHMTGSLRPLRDYSAHGSNSLNNPHPKLGVIVIVYNNRLMLPLITLGIKFDARTRETYRVAASIEQAEAIIAAERDQ